MNKADALAENPDVDKRDALIAYYQYRLENIRKTLQNLIIAADFSNEDLRL